MDTTGSASSPGISEPEEQGSAAQPPADGGGLEDLASDVYMDDGYTDDAPSVDGGEADEPPGPQNATPSPEGGRAAAPTGLDSVYRENGNSGNEARSTTAGPRGSRLSTPIDHEHWLGVPPELGATDWAAFPPVRTGIPGHHRSPAEAKRALRRRRRYTFFLRRTVRARQASRTATITRAAWATAIVMLALIVAVTTTAFGAAAAYYHSEEPLLRGLPQQVLSKDSVRIFDSKGTLLYQFNDFGSQHSVPLAQMPVNVVNATVAVEDRDFWVNQGVDFGAIVRAISTDLATNTIKQGGSTITQQLIKQQVLGSDVNFTRKLNEAILAFGMTTQAGGGGFSKRQILEMYLNSIPYSPTAYGIEAAAEEYFGYKASADTGMTAAQHLTLAQAAMLAGIPQNPNQNDPLLHPARALQRMKDVLTAMMRDGYITLQQAQTAYDQATKPGFYHPVTAEQNLAPHFVYFVRNQLRQMIDAGQLHNLSRSGLNVYTTLDLDLQNHAQQAMRDHLYGDDQTGFCCALIRNSNVSNAAAIMVDHHTGAIKVYLGSIDYYSAKFNTAKFDVVSQSFRGPGSSFKPIVYSLAFAKGWFPAMTVLDQPTVFWDAGSGTPFKPLDFTSNEAKGRVTLRTALDWSLNIPAVKVMQFVGVDAARAWAQRLGITQWPAVQRWGLSSVLGSLGVTPYEMAQAYTVFANYGQFIPLHSIDRITDSTGNVVFSYTVPQPVRVMDPRVAFLITSMLTDNASREGDFGGCSPLYLAPYFSLSHPHYTSHAAYRTPACNYMERHKFLTPDAWPTAAKTGTGQNFKDDWTMGYTMDYTMAVWVGNNNNSEMHRIDGVTGAAPIWYQSMLYAEASTGKARTSFPVPQGVHQGQYCSKKTCTTDWFLDGPPPPKNLGEESSGFPCVQILPDGGFVNSGHCDVALIPGRHQNIGAPPPTKTQCIVAPKCVGAP